MLREVGVGIFISSESGDVCSGTALSCRLSRKNFPDLIYVKPEFKGYGCESLHLKIVLLEAYISFKKGRIIDRIALVYTRTHEEFVYF